MLNSRIINLINKSMDGSAVNHTTISNNIANANTPYFKKSAVSFQKELEKSLNPLPELKKTSPLHLSGRNETTKGEFINITKVENTSLRNDANNVDVDMELAALAENNLYFNTMAQLLSSQLSLLRCSIEGR